MKQPLFLPCLLFAAALAGCPAAMGAAPPPNTAAAAAPVTVPITLRAGLIWVDGTINNKPAHFILDSGAGAMVVTPEAATRLGLRPDDTTVNAVGAASVAARRTTVARVGIGTALLRDNAAFIIALPEQLEGCDGLIGFDFLDKFTVTVDYARRRLTATAPKTAPAADATTVVLPLTFDSNIPVIDGTVDGIPGRFKVDSGSTQSLMLFTPFVEKNGLRTRYTPRLETLTGKGVGGFLYGDIVRVPTLTLEGHEPGAAGKATMTAVITELSHQTSGGFFSATLAGQIGADVLRRFTVTFDYAHKRLVLVPNTTLGDPFVFDRSGLWVDRQNERHIVVNVAPNSPGAAAGIAVGDEILTVNEIGANQYSASDLRDILRQKPGTVLRLSVRHSGSNGGDSGGAPATRAVTVTLRDLL